MRMSVAVEHHRCFKHGHGGQELRNLCTRCAHLNHTAACIGNVLVFLAEHGVRVNLNIILVAREFVEILAEKVHTDCFRFAFGFHTGNLDHDFAGRGQDGHCGTDQQTESANRKNETLHGGFLQIVF